MSTLTAKVTPGYLPPDGQKVTPSQLRQIATPTVDIEGSISSESIADNSVDENKLASTAWGNGLAGGNGTKVAVILADATLEFNAGALRVKDAAISTAKLADASVTTAKLADASVTVVTLASASLAPYQPVLGAARNLVVKINVATPNSKIDCTADELILKNAGGAAYLASALNLTADITTSGANGLDTGSVASSTWYYLWVIYDATTPAGPSALLSLSKTAPTLPGTYTYRVLVGAVLTDGSSHFSSFIAYGPVTKFKSGAQTFTPGTPVSLPHNLGAMPMNVQWMLVNTSTDAGYSVGDEVAVQSFNGSSSVPNFAAGKTATSVFITPTSNANPGVPNKATGANTGITPSKWQFVCYAQL